MGQQSKQSGKVFFLSLEYFMFANLDFCCICIYLIFYCMTFCCKLSCFRDFHSSCKLQWTRIVSADANMTLESQVLFSLLQLHIGLVT